LWKISVILAIAVLGVMVNLKPQEITAQQQPEPQSDQPPGTTEETVNPRRLSMTFQVETPQEILVKDGDRLIAGQIVASNQQIKTDLIAQKQETQLALKVLTSPLLHPPAPPEPSYANEKAAIDSAKAAIAYWEKLPEPEFRFIDKNLVTTFEQDVLEKRQEIARRKMQAHFTLNTAIANLQEAEANYQKELYSHQLKLLEIDQEERRRLTEAISLREKIATLDKALQDADFKSPYSGKIRKVRILGQNGRLLNVEILVINPNPTDNRL
jgi:multidrug efflux pump subunit AcrA (membrane-fusion protein)